MGLPDPICEMLDIIEHFTGSQVVSIGNGPKGDEIVYIKRVLAGKDGAKASSPTKGLKNRKVKADTKPKDPEERRIDPDDGRAYTWRQLRMFYLKKFKEEDILD